MDRPSHCQAHSPPGEVGSGSPRRLLSPPARTPVAVPPRCGLAECATASMVPPPVEPRLQRVYGYECTRNAAQNVLWAAGGHVVTFAAALGVVMQVPSTAAAALQAAEVSQERAAAAHENRSAQAHAPGQAFFRGHGNDVLCIAVSPDGVLAATGQVGSHCSLWHVGQCADVCTLAWTLPPDVPVSNCTHSGIRRCQDVAWLPMLLHFAPARPIRML